MLSASAGAAFYRLSDKGLRLTRRAEHKIYRASAPEWDGTWLLLLGRHGEKCARRR